MRTVRLRPLSAAAHTSLLALLSPFRWLGGAMASPRSSFSFLGALGFPVCSPPSGLPRGLRSFRASAGGEMSLSRWESRASPEAPPCSTPAEAPHTCTHSSSTAYTLVRTVL